MCQVNLSAVDGAIKSNMIKRLYYWVGTLEEQTVKEEESF